jgi:hypothetical protein
VVMVLVMDRQLRSFYRKIPSARAHIPG